MHESRSARSSAGTHQEGKALAGATIWPLHKPDAVQRGRVAQHAEQLGLRGVLGEALRTVCGQRDGEGANERRWDATPEK